jgi:muconolactone D-isomerase
MEFLVRIQVRWPPDGDESVKEGLIAREAARARELASSGLIVRLWRSPGRWANLGIWKAKDATELHEAISSLPFFPWLEVHVEPLAHHPSDPAGLGGSPYASFS